MSRLIDADELTVQIMSMILDKAIVYGNNAVKGSKEIFALAMVAQAPTVDAEPVIRCKDCRFHRGKYCTAWGDGSVAVSCETDADGFCAWAERKETEQ